MNTIKYHSTKIITLKRGNKTTKFIPHKLHQLPKNYKEIPMSQQFHHKGFCYISSDELEWNKNKEARLTSNYVLGGLATR